jgi:bifunctional non-homologous end joining protein LigD
VACDDNGLAVFDRLRYRRADTSVFLYAFDLLELDGQDLRREPLETRKATLASLLRGCRPGVRLNEHLEHDDGAVVFRHACVLGDWIKMKNPVAPAVKREAEEDWGKERWR